MVKQASIEQDGLIIEALSNAKFKVPSSNSQEKELIFQER